MAKVKTTFFCQNCGAQYAKWQGQCNSCKEWNTIAEEIIQKQEKAKLPINIGEVFTEHARPLYLCLCQEDSPLVSIPLSGVVEFGACEPRQDRKVATAACLLSAAVPWQHFSFFCEKWCVPAFQRAS